jgi:hypothetical protein
MSGIQRYNLLEQLGVIPLLIIMGEGETSESQPGINRRRPMFAYWGHRSCSADKINYKTAMCKTENHLQDCVNGIAQFMNRIDLRLTI